MSAAFVLGLALVLVALGVLLLALAIVLRRVLRLRLGARRSARSAPYRVAVLRLVAGEAGEAGEAAELLAAVRPAQWRALEPGLAALLGKVTGDSHAQLVELLARRGTLDRARAATRSPDPVRRARAAHLLGQARQRQARPEVERLLGDRDADVRRVAAAALGHLGDPRSTAPLLATLAASRSVPASVVASAVAELGHWAHAALFQAIGDPSPLVRAVAIEVCGLAGAVPSAPVVRAALRHDPEIEVRVRAARALGRLGAPGAVADLLAAADPGEPPALRMVVARALGDIGSVQAVVGLRRLLQAPEHRVAANAAAALARIGGVGIVALHEVAAGQDPAAREAAAGLAHAALSPGRPAERAGRPPARPVAAPSADTPAGLGGPLPARP